jgi:hypothetical protein
MALRRHGWTEEDVKGSADFVCPTCVEQQQPKVARPGKLRAPTDLNAHISFDGAEWKDSQGNASGPVPPKDNGKSDRSFLKCMATMGWSTEKQDVRQCHRGQ